MLFEQQFVKTIKIYKYIDNRVKILSIYNKNNRDSKQKHSCKNEI